MRTFDNYFRKENLLRNVQLTLLFKHLLPERVLFKRKNVCMKSEDSYRTDKIFKLKKHNGLECTR